MARPGEDRTSKVLREIINSESSSAEAKLTAIKVDRDRKRDYERRKTRKATEKLKADNAAAKVAAAEAEESNRQSAEAQAAAQAISEEEQRLRAKLKREEHEAEVKRKAQENEAKLTEHETWHATQITKFQSLQQLANVPGHKKCVKGTECRSCRPGRGVHTADIQARWKALPRQTDEEIVKAPQSSDPFWDGFWDLSTYEQNLKLQNCGTHMVYYRQMRDEGESARARLERKKLGCAENSRKS